MQYDKHMCDSVSEITKKMMKMTLIKKQSLQMLYKKKK